jgi:hypothetical protein
MSMSEGRAVMDEAMEKRLGNAVAHLTTFLSDRERAFKNEERRQQARHTALLELLAKAKEQLDRIAEMLKGAGLRPAVALRSGQPFKDPGPHSDLTERTRQAVDWVAPTLSLTLDISPTEQPQLTFKGTARGVAMTRTIRHQEVEGIGDVLDHSFDEDLINRVTAEFLEQLPGHVQPGHGVETSSKF